MNFLNPLPIFFWLIPLIPILIFLINRRKYELIEFSSIRFLINLKTTEINKIRLLNILLLIIRTLILIIILIIVMRPEINSINLSTNISDSKITNIILVDDSFSNKYGKIYGQERVSIIETMIDDICENYSLSSTLQIINLNQGVLFDGFNSHNINYSSFNFTNNDSISISHFLKQKDESDFKNLHIISNANKYSFEKIKKIYDSIDDDNFKFFYHYLPESSNNQYISNINLINNANGLFYYEIEIGNDYEENIDLVLSAKQNLYTYDSLLTLRQRIPILNKNITVNSKSFIKDTISIHLSPNRFMEILFELGKKEQNLVVDLIDDRVEDNTYSYIMNLPENINISILYDNEKNIKYIAPALDAFSLITNNIDSNFLNIKYIQSEGLKKYSNSIFNKDILFFLGYNIFLRSDKDIFSNFLKNKNAHIIIFPTKDDIKNNSIANKYIFELNDSLTIQYSYKENFSNTYDKIELINKNYFLNDELYDNDFKLSNYFFDNINENTIFKTVNSNHSVWSRYNLNNGHLDFFGFLVDYGNNLFNSEATYSIPFLYSIIVDEKISSEDNNLFMNDKINSSDIDANKLKIININNDSLIFFSPQKPMINSKDLKALINNEELIALYAFNPKKENFHNSIKVDLISSESKINLIPYNNNQFKGKFSDILYSNEITKYFIYLLILLLLIEIYLSNGKSQKST